MNLFAANNKYKSLGLFHANDEVYITLLYQF